jgi:hypothetical protein
MPLRPSVLSTAFASLFGVMAILAATTALGTSGPWFGAGLSMLVYALALALSTALILVTVLVTTIRVASIDRGMHRIEAKVESMRQVATIGRASPARGSKGTKPRDLESELETIAFGGRSPGSATELDHLGHDSLFEVEDVVQVIPVAERQDTLRALLRERITLRDLRARVRNLAAGPFVAGLAFLAAAAVMLPGSDSFATSHFQLNTALVLFLSYGLAPLVAWTSMALALLHARDTPV